MGFSRQEYWSWLPFPSPGDLPKPLNPGLPHCRQTLYRLSHQGSHLDNIDNLLKSRDKHFANKGLDSQSYGFSSSHVWMWELDHREGWALKNWCFWSVVLEKTLESPLEQQNKPKRNQPSISLEGLMLKPQYFGHLMRRADSLEKTLMLGKTEGRRRGWQRTLRHHQLNGHEFEQSPGDGGGPIICSYLFIERNNKK